MSLFSWWKRLLQPNVYPKPTADDEPLTTEELIERASYTPAARYVSSVIAWLVERGDPNEAVTLLPNTPLPDICQGTALVLHEHESEFSYREVVNRLKIMCDLNPLPYNELIQGAIPVIIVGSDSDPRPIKAGIRVHIQPRDAAVRIELEKLPRLSL